MLSRVVYSVSCTPCRSLLRSLCTFRLGEAGFSLAASCGCSLVLKPPQASSLLWFYSQRSTPLSSLRFFGLSSVSRAKSVENDGGEGARSSGKPSDNDQKGKKFLTGMFIGTVVAVVVMTVVTNTWQTRNTNQLTVHDLLTHIVPTGQVEQVIITSNNIARVIMKPVPIQNLPFSDLGYNMFKPGVGWQKVYVVTAMDAKKLESDIRAVETALGRSPQEWAPVAIIDTSMEGILACAGTLQNSFQDMLGMKTKLNVFNPNDPNAAKIKFKDVAGLHEAKVEIREFVDYLKHPEKYTKLGARLPKGALLTGPPGCGKTYLAKALAAESSVPFISMNGTEFVEMIGGLGASRVRNLFKTAKKMAPCIIYIDEIDAIGRKRSQSDFAGAGSREEEQTLNQLLVEMDGIDSCSGIVLLGSTNRGDILDKALLRPGRFDRHIIIDLPTALERQEMFEIYLSKIVLDHKPRYYSKRLAQMTPRFSGADIANIVNEAAIRAASAKKKEVTVEDLDASLQRVLAGAEKRSKSMVEEEREIVAYHESGHALIGWLLEHTDALLRVSIIPRTSAKLGFAQYSPRERKLLTKEELFDRMCMLLGGRAAENVTFGRVTTGAENDLKMVTKSAYAQVQLYGMSEAVGLLSFPLEEDNKKNDMEFYRKPFSMKLHHMIDREVSSLVSKAYFTAEEILKNNRDQLKKLADSLLQNEVLSYEDVVRLIGPPKFPKQIVELADHVLPKVDDIQ